MAMSEDGGNSTIGDPFADAIKGSDDDVQDGLVHIRIQQRNGRKTLTTVQGLASEYDLKKIVRACKKVSSAQHIQVEAAPTISSSISTGLLLQPHSLRRHSYNKLDC
ncbi:unnamed protein product [Timema podura]|uniref:SUI1 domain-containing protein n=1 Tax=Timema podura TaxID=61482 RepID=A0ABN7NPB3_TIMPD|nr:unnamed protein product [Timema podura]